MRLDKVISDCNTCLMDVADALFSLSTKHEIGRVDRVIFQKYIDDLMVIRQGLLDMNGRWEIENEKQRKSIEQEEQRD